MRRAVVGFTAGHVYYINCSYIEPPHEKISLCICPIRHWFFWINSEPRFHGIAQIAVRPADHPSAIVKPCYLDLSSIKTFGQSDLASARDTGVLSGSLRGTVVAALRSPIKNLPDIHRLAGLNALYRAEEPGL